MSLGGNNLIRSSIPVLNLYFYIPFVFFFIGEIQSYLKVYDVQSIRLAVFVIINRRILKIL